MRPLGIVPDEMCCGCAACANVCPQKCITLNSDSKGFIYPYVEMDKCIRCKRCESVCPVLNNRKCSSLKPLHVYAAKNPDEGIRMKSSSGGIFTMLAEKVIEKGGVVFGARFDENWNVVHDYTESLAGIGLFRGSKYVQSRIGDCFRKAKQFLDDDREVLFSGTPCQVAGLRQFLHRPYANLYCVEVVCHGVPSPLVFRHYISSLEKKHNGTVCRLKFRDKSNGWKAYEIVVEFDNGKIYRSRGRDNAFIKGFIGNLFLRQSCTKCVFKSFKSGADITLGDFWGSEKFGQEYNDDKGISLVCINSNNGLRFFDLIKSDVIGLIESSLVDAITYNLCLVESVKMHRKEHKFYRSYTGKEFDVIVSRLLHNSRFWMLLNEIIPYYYGIIIGKVKIMLCRR
ncbi:MAG: Coenzyme F420 hydrogenase/dehydrogenase, beta subunit C-terminal domain [Muribaculaceae bacterium]|nr:Coenzyme F420 hydrogenase/dehydrogenase, beta subunit C-terminal domain [Muribaculaceae bacterium]